MHFVTFRSIHVALSVAAFGINSATLHAQVRSTGLNVFGHLGNGGTIDSNTPAAISLDEVVAIAGGGTHTLAIRADGSVWGWGSHAYGQVGDGTSGPANLIKSSPVQVVNIANVTAVAAGQVHSLALVADGTVRSWGANGSGQLGFPMQQSAPVVVPQLSDVISVTAGLRSSLALKSDGTVRYWGANAQTFSPAPQTQVENLTSVIAIAAGHLHFLALKDDGTLWGWGFNDSGQIGDGSTDYRATPVQVIHNFTSPIRAISAGGHHSFALLNDGTVYAWGSNTYGQLGIGNTTNAPEPTLITALSSIIKISAGGSHSLALQAGGAVYAWGANTYGQLGDGTTDDRNTPTLIALPAPASNIAAGGMTSFMITGPSPSCLADTNYDASVDVQDLLGVINAWGPCAPPSIGCPDIAPAGGDGEVNVIDLLAIINAWGECP